MASLGGTPGIIKLVAFILVTITWGASYGVTTSISIGPLVTAVCAGFFWHYLVTLVGMFTEQIDSEVCQSWAIYACIAYFGTGLRAIVIYADRDAGSNIGAFAPNAPNIAMADVSFDERFSNDDRIYVLIFGILAVITSVFCFLDAFFTKK